jgi:hypothetical protein
VMEILQQPLESDVEAVVTARMAGASEG